MLIIMRCTSVECQNGMRKYVLCVLGCLVWSSKVEALTAWLGICRSSGGMAMNLNVPQKDIIGLMGVQMIQWTLVALRYKCCNMQFICQITALEGPSIDFVSSVPGQFHRDWEDLQQGEWCHSWNGSYWGSTCRGWPRTAHHSGRIQRSKSASRRFESTETNVQLCSEEIESSFQGASIVPLNCSLITYLFRKFDRISYVLLCLQWNDLLLCSFLTPYVCRFHRSLWCRRSLELPQTRSWGESYARSSPRQSTLKSSRC